MSSRMLKVQEWQQLAVQAEFHPEHLATLCGLSERQVQRIFKRRFRKTPSRWLRELQCCLAKELVSQGYRTKAIAAQLRFASDAHFCREFKKAFGSAPQTFAPIGQSTKCR